MERSSRLFPGFQRVCDAPTTFRASLSASRAISTIHTVGPLKPRFWPQLSVVSLSQLRWVKRSCSRSFSRNLPGLASEREGKTKSGADSLGHSRHLASGWNRRRKKPNEVTIALRRHRCRQCHPAAGTYRPLEV